MTRIQDLADEAADQLQTEHALALSEQGPDMLNDREVMIRDLKKGLFSKIVFKWRPDDEKILAQVRAAVDQLFQEMFEEAINVIDAFYEEMKIPSEVDGVVEKDTTGRIIWKKDSEGRDIEDWSQLTGQDIEKTLLDLTKLKMILAPQANDLLLEAIFAKHIFDDAQHEAYTNVMDGTIRDREANASRVSRADKYHAFYKFYLYSQAEVFLKELANFARVLERIRYWRIDAQDGPTAP